MRINICESIFGETILRFFMNTKWRTEYPTANRQDLFFIKGKQQILSFCRQGGTTSRLIFELHEDNCWLPGEKENGNQISSVY